MPLQCGGDSKRRVERGGGGGEGIPPGVVEFSTIFSRGNGLQFGANDHNTGGALMRRSMLCLMVRHYKYPGVCGATLYM